MTAAKALTLLFVFLIISPLNASSGETVLFCAAGDVLLDRGCRMVTRNNGFDYLFEPVRSFIQSYDLAFCNLEGPLSSRKKPSIEKMRFCADSSSVEVLKRSGFDIYSIANNHMLDYGRRALMETRSILETNGLIGVGAGKNKNEAVAARIIETKGTKVAFLAFTTVSNYGTQLPENLPCPAIADSATVADEITKCRSRADIVIVSFHWGVEYSRLPSAEQIQLAHLSIDCGADLVIGHHPHVIQSIEKYKGKFILYSLGNFAFDQHKQEQRESIIFSCAFSDRKVEFPRIFPVIIPDRIYRPELAGCEDSIRITDRIKKLSKDFSTGFRDGDIEVYLE